MVVDGDDQSRGLSSNGEDTTIRPIKRKTGALMVQSVALNQNLRLSRLLKGRS